MKSVSTKFGIRNWLIVGFIFLFTISGAQNYNINTIAGNGTPGFSGDGGPASNAKLNSPTGVAFDNHGHILIVDHQNARIRKIDKNSGVITTIAGNGVAGFSGDGGPATAAQLNNPTAVHVVSNGHILIVDRDNARIRKIDGATGIITTIAGNGVHGFSGDGGPAVLAKLNHPNGVATNSVGDIFIADEGNSRVRIIDHTSGNIRTFAGNGLFGFLGDGGLATLAVLNSPCGVAVDNNDHVLIVDKVNARIRKVDKNTGIITTIVGNGILGFGGDGGLATLAKLNSPTHVLVNSNNHIHVVDQMNMRIRKVDVNTGIITTIIGSGIAGFSGDGGDALLAKLNTPVCAAINLNDVIVIADQLNHRIRECQPVSCFSPVISVHPINASVCVDSNVSFSVVASGVGLSYQWQVDQGGGFINIANAGIYNGVTSATLNITGATADLNSSHYRVKVTNTCGSVFSNYATLTIKLKPALLLSVNGNACSETSVCESENVIITATGASTYLWSNGSVGSSITVSPTTSTTYSVTGTNIDGCSSFASFFVNVKAKPNVSINASPPSICPGGTSVLTASGASSYVWSTGATTASISVSPSASTNYSVVGTASNGCSASASITVVVNSNPSVSITASPSVICSGGSSVLTASGASTYVWSTGQTGNVITVSPATTTDYTVTGTSSGGCTATATVTVTVKPKPVVTTSASSTIICPGETSTLTASGAAAYIWSTGETTASITVSPVITSTYTVTGTTDGCSTTALVTVMVNESVSLSVSATSSLVCEGESTTLTAVGAESYSWSTGQIGSTIVVNPSIVTTYSVTGTSSGSCAATASITIDVKAKPDITVVASNSTICSGSSTTLRAAGADAYIWSTGQTGESITVDPTATTTYQVTGYSNGCSTDASITINVNNSPNISISASSSSICPGQSVTLNASGANTYSWNTGETTSTIYVSPSTTTTYSVTGSLNGCQATESVTIFVNSINLNVSASQSVVCPGGSSQLSAIGASTYVWSTGETTASIVVNPNVTTTYSVTGYSNGCSATASITIGVTSSIVITASASPSTICEGSTSLLVASGADTYLWSTGQNGASIAVTPASTTTYNVTGFKNGCSGNASVTVNVNPRPPVTCTASPSIITLGLTSTLTASGAVSYQWNTGAIGSTLLVIPLATTTYSVVGTDANGCTNTASATVTVNLLGLSGGLLSGRSASEPTENTEVEAIEVSTYPNPTEGTIFIKGAPLRSYYEVYNLNGVQVLDGLTTEPVEKVDLQNYASGIYLIRIRSDNKVIYKDRLIRN